MQRTKMELERMLRDKCAVIARLENEGRLARDQINDLIADKLVLQNRANCRGLIIKYLSEEFFTSQDEE